MNTHTNVNGQQTEDFQENDIISALAYCDMRMEEAKDDDAEWFKWVNVSNGIIRATWPMGRPEFLREAVDAEVSRITAVIGLAK